MITQIRRGLKSKGFKAAVWIFLFIMAGGGVIAQLVFNIFESTQWAFKVNGSLVSAQEFKRKTLLEDEYIRAIKSHLGPQADMYLQLYGISNNPKELAKNQLIRETLLNQQAKKIGFRLDPDYVIEKVNDPSFVSSSLIGVIPISAFVPGSGIDSTRLYTELKRFNLTESDFEQAIDLALKRYVFVNQLLSPAAYVPNFSKKYEYQMKYGPRTISFSKLGYDDVLAQERKEEVSHEELQAFYDKETKSQKYRIPEKRDGKMWRFDAGQYGLTIPDNRIEDYYNTHKTDFVKDRAQIQVRHISLKVEDPSEHDQVKKRAEDIHAQLKQDPSLFAQLAQQYSQDEASSQKGGLLPYFSKGALNNVAIEKAAFLLSEDGQISPIIKTEGGYEIVQRVGRKPQVHTPFAEVKDDIVDRLIQKKFEQRFVGDIKALFKQRKMDENQWSSFIKNKSPKVQPLSNVEQQDSNFRLAQVLYKLKAGEYDVYLDGQIGVVVRLDHIKEAQIPSLESIKNKVLNDRHKYRASRALETQLKEIHYESQKSSLEEASDQKGLPVNTITIDPTDPQRIKELENQGLPLQKMLQLENKGGVARVMMGEDGYLVRLDDLEDVDLDAIEEQKKEELAHQMLQETISYLGDGYIASLYRDATIKIDNSLVQSTG